jgi:hypothetical protein
LSDNATVADERGEYVGDAAREWLVRTSNDGMHLRLVNVSRIDTDERGTPGHTTWWLIFTVAVSWDADRNLGYTPYRGEASAILGGSLIHSFRLQPLSPPFQPLIDAPVPPTERPGEFAGWPSPWPPVIVTAGVALFGVFVLIYRRRVHTRQRVVTSTQMRMLYALHQATLHRRADRA